MTLTGAIGLGINVALVVLLSLTLIYLWRLHRAMAAVRDGQGALQQMIVRLNEATERAQDAMHQMRAAATETSDVLRLRTEAGRRLAEDLGIAIGAGERLTGRLEQGLASSRASSAPVRSDTVITKLKGVR
jgi:Domain of unknown function (DUF6468)